ncbi:LRR_1 domain-containing protein/LRRNT_2 domain-containing protein/LRR_8 domain-containing protein [Cephalotus follicularis]|uniref:LRR_1 domain-containing protein/LRRNT_2 domain-containing protein/LRR_8 domain-containing protein n=1 Tax=Cephalotus follicularis TaxID=3775 RepID=A0A1Q3ANR3_CEPFO|nr:LRR_1 domain-containing protein/LRRNT_2 domain-containing protein/LRR_8 domain-containing protein [Cephalotus follicularis]
MAQKTQYPLLLLLLAILHIAPDPTLEQQHEDKIIGTDLAALSAIKNSLTDIPGGTSFFSTWDLASPDPCSTFSGITCSLNRVTTLTLGTDLSDSPGLAGTLSASISNLTQLTQVVLFPGLVTGPIPPELGQLSNLRVISLTNNRLTGPIPDSLSSLQNLHTLDLSYNQLTGSTPRGLTRLPQLKVLILASNRLSGELAEVSTQLLHLDLKGNGLTGPLPKWLPSSLRYLSVSDNLMEGPLNGLESVSNLVYLDLSMNQFSGAIPASLFRPSLSSMFLQRNNLSGGLPIVDPASSSSSLSYGAGSILDLSHNLLTGGLSWGILGAGVESLFLNNNRLMGTVPKEYVERLYLGNTKTLYLQHNYITGFPLDASCPLPDSVSLCLSYNCIIPPPVGLTGCPASAGAQLSRPISQCSFFNKG